jgi:hypothetical protein
MKKKTALLATEDDLLVDLTFHGVSDSLLTEAHAGLELK